MRLRRFVGIVEEPRTKTGKTPVPPTRFFDEEADLKEYKRGVEAFNKGDHYRAHDHFEALWGEEFWKGLVQAAVALHHHGARNPRGVKGLPENVERILARYRPAYAGIDVDRFLDDFRSYFRRVEDGEDPPLAQAPRLQGVFRGADTNAGGKTD